MKRRYSKAEVDNYIRKLKQQGYKETGRTWGSTGTLTRTYSKEIDGKTFSKTLTFTTNGWLSIT